MDSIFRGATYTRVYTVSAKTIKELHAKLTVKEAWVFQSKQASRQQVTSCYIKQHALKQQKTQIQKHTEAVKFDDEWLGREQLVVCCNLQTELLEEMFHVSL